MIFVPKKYIYFVGGCTKDTFFYDTSSNLFGEWAPLKQEKTSPALALVNNRYLYAFFGFVLNYFYIQNGLHHT